MLSIILSSITAIIALIVPLLTKNMEIRELRRERYHKETFLKKQEAFSNFLMNSGIALNHASTENIGQLLKSQYIALLYADDELYKNINSFLDYVIETNLYNHDCILTGFAYLDEITNLMHDSLKQAD